MRCKKCSNTFTPNGTEFCSRAHQRQFEAKSNQCRAKDKKTYESADAAWAYIDSRPDDKLFKTNLRPYDDCPCRKIHIGHGAANKYSRQEAS